MLLQIIEIILRGELLFSMREFDAVTLLIIITETESAFVCEVDHFGLE